MNGAATVPVTVHSAVAPSAKTTVPVGCAVPELMKVMVELNVTCSLTIELAGKDELREIEVAPAPTDCTSVPVPDEGEALPKKFESPL